MSVPPRYDWRVRLELLRWRLGLDRVGERLTRWIAWHLPHEVVMWATIRASSNATTGPWGHEEAPGVTLDKILKRWGDREGGEFSRPA